MLLILGILIVIAVLTFICVASWHGKIGAQLGISLAVVAVIAAIVVANFPDMAGLVVKSGEKDLYSIQFQKVERAAQQVQTDADEVRQMKEQIKTLVKRVEQGEQNVSAMQNNVRQAYQSLFESLGYVALTRNLFPPPERVMKEMERHINVLGTFAYPDEKERTVTIQKMMNSVQRASQPSEK